MSKKKLTKKMSDMMERVDFFEKIIIILKDKQIVKKNETNKTK